MTPICQQNREKITNEGEELGNVDEGVNETKEQLRKWKTNEIMETFEECFVGN